MDSAVSGSGSSLKDILWNANDVFAPFRGLSGLSSSGSSHDLLLSAEFPSSLSSLLSWAASAPGGNGSPEHVDRCYRVLEKFLELENAKLIPKMIEFLTSDGAILALIAFIVRPRAADNCSADPVAVLRAAELKRISSNPDALESSRIRRNEENTQLSRELMMSYRAMELLSSSPKPIVNCFVSHMEKCICALFEIFSTGSCGNFFHFKKVFDWVLALDSLKLLKVVTKRELLPLNLLKPYLAVPAVMETILKLVTVTCNWSQREAKEGFYGYLRNEMFITILFDLICNSPDDDTVAYLADSFVDVFELLTIGRGGEILLRESIWSSAVGNLAECAVRGGHSYGRRKTYFDLMFKLLNKSDLMLAEQEYKQHMTVEVADQIAGMRCAWLQSAVSYFKQLCDITLDVQVDKSEAGSVELSAYTVPKPLSAMRLSCMKIVEHIVQFEPSTLSRISKKFWKRSVDWFFEYKFNSFYQNMFWNMFTVVMEQNHEPSFRQLLGKRKFVSRCIDHYVSDKRKTELRGYLIRMLNMLRLSCDVLEADEYVSKHLRCHSKWIAFLPRLRDDTVREQIRNCPLPPNFRPSTDFVGNFDGIDIGSSYARTLGFLTEKLADLQTVNGSTSSLSDESSSTVDDSDGSPGTDMDDLSPLATTVHMSSVNFLAASETGDSESS